MAPITMLRSNAPRRRRGRTPACRSMRIPAQRRVLERERELALAPRRRTAAGRHERRRSRRACAGDWRAVASQGRATRPSRPRKRPVMPLDPRRPWSLVKRGTTMNIQVARAVMLALLTGGIAPALAQDAAPTPARTPPARVRWKSSSPRRSADQTPGHADLGMAVATAEGLANRQAISLRACPTARSIAARRRSRRARRR